MVRFFLTMFTVPSVTVMLQVMRRITSATPAPANAYIYEEEGYLLPTIARKITC